MKKKNRRGKKKLIIGLTGSFGSGKTTVAKIFSSYGAKVIDADRIAHKAIRPQGEIYKKIVNAFGEDIIKKDKTIHRGKLAKIVFAKKDSLTKLNKIMHPEVIRIIKGKINALSRKIIILDAPLIIEAGLANLADKLIVVRLSPKKRIERLINKTHLSKTDILKRINAQIPQAGKVALADFVIDNNGTIGRTRKQVEKIWRLLWKN